MRSIHWCRAVGLAALVTAATACVSTGRRSCGDVNAGIALLHLRSVTDSVADAVGRAGDSSATVLRSTLQDAVDRTAALDACGRLSTAALLREAGAIALTASRAGTGSLEQAYRWARRAVVLDGSDRGSWRVLAESWDELQVAENRPQWFGTVIACAPGATGRCELAPLDSARVSEAQRVELGLRTVQQQRERLDVLNRERRGPERRPPSRRGS
ncbi:MAG: hypothetical protein IT355_00520 [Gemmatimonadaceae bacterium]|nr:hypothetical protein [Gemmatimonadaceae bacterium]